MDSNDEIYVAGYVTIGAGNYAWCMKKYDHATGAEIPWIGASGVEDYSTGYDTAVSMARDSSDNIYVVGRVATTGNGYDWMMRKYDTAGNPVSPWPIQYDRSGENDQVYAVTVDSGDNVYVTGYTTQSSDIDWTVIKLNPSGGEVSRDVITNTGADWCRAIVVDSQDYVYGVGGIVRSGTGADWFIKRYAP